MNTLRFIILTCLSFLLTLNAFGFGATGHRVVGEIAENHLTPEAKIALREILGNEPLAFAATWPDEMRSSKDDPTFWSYSAAANWHFVNLEDGASYEESKKNPKGDAFIALNTFIAILECDEIPDNAVSRALTSYLGDLNDKENLKAAKVFAVKFIIHIVGDLHQPLHAGRSSDLGGNKITVKWFGKTSNLHKVWDEGLVDYPGLSFTEIVRRIDRISEEEISKIQSSEPLDWLNEAIVMREHAYNLEDYKSNLLSYDFAFINVPIIEMQMLKGGIRTAGLFNSIFSN